MSDLHFEKYITTEVIQLMLPLHVKYIEFFYQ